MVSSFLESYFPIVAHGAFLSFETLRRSVIYLCPMYYFGGELIDPALATVDCFQRSVRGIIALGLRFK